MEHVVSGCGCPGKRCSKCHAVHCVGNFTKARSRKDGLDPWCRACQRISRQAYRAANYEKSRACQERSYRKNLPHYRAYQHAYLAAHREEINQKRRQMRYQATPAAKATRQRYVEAHREAIAAVKREAVRLYRARKRAAGEQFTRAEWQALCAWYEYTCLCCGKKAPDIKLTTDHVVPVSKGGSNAIANIQPLCIDCNNHKGTKIIDHRPHEKGA
ncbi:MAG TPA: HNH endonuclease [Ktedonobacterales bacterium]|nr:HNH endonuclease [Ktedonobacterales bacterium]